MENALLIVFGIDLAVFALTLVLLKAGVGACKVNMLAALVSAGVIVAGSFYGRVPIGRGSLDGWIVGGLVGVMIFLTAVMVTTFWKYQERQNARLRELDELRRKSNS